MNHLCLMTTRVEDYLYARRQLGFKLKSQGTQLLAFARFAENGSHQGPVTLELALRWARDSDSAKPITAAKRIEVLRPFIRYLQQFDPATQVPPPKLLGSTHRRPAPHIYSDEEIEALLAAAGQLRPSGGLRPATYQTLFGLLAATGMRISEALRLERADVLLEHGMLVVRQSKYRNYAAFLAMPIRNGRSQIQGEFAKINRHSLSDARLAFTSDAAAHGEVIP
jgi:integrase